MADKKDKRGTPYQDVVDPGGKLLIRIGHYKDPIVDKPEGFSRFLDFLPVFLRQVEKGEWASLAFDSMSFAYLSGRKYHQYDLNEDSKDPRQWYGGGVDLLEEILCVQLPALPCNVGVATHVSKTKVEAEGTMVRAPMAPGRLLNMVAAAWPELYRVYVEEKEGRKVRRLQTDNDEKWQAGTCIKAPDPCRPRFEDLWVNWPKGEERSWWHGLIYGEPHIGKSTFLATLPTPLYVAMFDGYGKDMAYRMRGKVVG